MNIKKRSREILDKQDYLSRFDVFVNEMRQLQVGKSGFEYYRREVLNSYGMLRDLVAELDFSKLNRGETNKLKILMLDTLPYLQRKTLQRAPVWDWDDVKTAISGHLTESIKKISKITANQSLIAATPLKTVNHVVEVDTVWQRLENGNKVVFPALTGAAWQVQQPYDHLRETWERASLKTLSTEDTYQLGAIAADYLPESIRLLTQLGERSSLARSESERMFVRQLELLQQQVDEILAKETAQTLSTMEAHTRFLESKVKNPLTSAT